MALLSSFKGEGLWKSKNSYKTTGPVLGALTNKFSALNANR